MFNFLLKKENVIIVLLYLIFLGDCYNSFFAGRFFNVSHIFKGILLIIIFQWLFQSGVNLKKHLSIFYLVVAFFISFSIEFLVNGLNTRDLYLSLALVLKYLFPILIFLYLKHLAIRDELVDKFLIFVFLSVAIASIVAFFFDISIFKTYYGERFGYKALLASQNEATFFYMLGIAFFYRYYKNRRKLIYLLCVIIVGSASMILGTKASFLGIGLFIAFWFFEILKDRRYLLGISGGVMSVAVIIFIIYSGILDYYIDLASKEGLAYMITSKRNEYLLVEFPSIIHNWDWYNFLFGEFKHEINLLEMDVVDLFLLFGCVGTFVYLYVLLKTIFKFSKTNLLGWLLFCQFIIIGGLAGHVFSSGINAIYLALVSNCLQVSESKYLVCK